MSFSQAPPSTRLSRGTIARAIVSRLAAEKDRLRSTWLASTPVGHVVVDDLLPEAIASELHGRLPSPEQLLSRSSLRERKRVGVDLEHYDPAVAEILFAFQSPEVVELVEEITGLPEMEPDPTLYASGLSVMVEGGFLNPHLDNSHDGDQARYRVLNLLYYLSPGWTLSHGGNLELWDRAVRQPTPVVSAFNRLVLMKTDRHSWHSVTRVVSQEPRWCVSNYYFSRRSPSDGAYRHVTTFAGRPEEAGKRFLLAVDGLALNALGRMFPSLLRRTKHRRANEAEDRDREVAHRTPPDETGQHETGQHEMDQS